MTIDQNDPSILHGFCGCIGSSQVELKWCVPNLLCFHLSEYPLYKVKVGRMY